MKKRTAKSLFNIFAVLLLFFVAAFISYWNNSMTDIENDTSDRRILVYSVYLISLFSVYIWALNFDIKLKGIHIICFLWCFIMPIIIALNHGKVLDVFQTILWPILFEASYMLVRHEKYNLNSFRKLFVIIAIYGGYFFLQSRIEMMSNRHIQSNTIYFVFLTLPWLLLVKKDTNRLLLLILFTLLGIWSLKRSIMLCIVFIWFFYFVLLLSKFRNKLLSFFLILFLAVGFIYIYTYGDQMLGGELSQRINQTETDEGGGRIAIYSLVWSMIKSSSPQYLITGHGHFAVRQDSLLELSAHNDFLEVIYDYGLVIFVLYIVLWVYVIRRCIMLYRNKSKFFFPYAVSLCIFLVLSMVSHLILYTSYFNYLVLFWGCIEGFNYKKVIV